LFFLELEPVREPGGGGGGARGGGGGGVLMDGVGVDVWSAELLRDDLRTSTGAEISYMKKKWYYVYFLLILVYQDSKA
jgi:hypothetical protein